MSRKISILFLSAFIFVGVPAFAQPAPREILSNSVPAIVARLTPVGNYPETNHLNLAISLPVRNQAALDEFLKEIYDPAGTNYHKFLTPQEFAAQFAPLEEDYQSVIAFAEDNGLTVMAQPNRLVLDVEGSVADIERVFQVRLRVYQHPTEARTFYAPDGPPSVNANAPILSVSGLDNFAIPRPMSVLLNFEKTMPKSGSGPSGTYGGNDFRAAYMPGVTLDGSGQSVALLEFDGYYSNDIVNYENTFGLPAVSLTNIAVDGGVSKPGTGNSEVALDIEMVIAMAPGVSRIIVYEAPNPSPWVDIISRIANDNLAKQISCSWGGGLPDAASEQFFKQMAAQGQSFFNASGDSDAFTGVIPFPSDSTNITQVGGTTLTTAGAGGAWSSETVWNWGRVKGSYVGSSGGISTTYSIPAWQLGINMVTNHGSTTMRNVPDVALAADNIYVKYNNGSSGNFGGTSCAAPLWAAVTALANQRNAVLSLPPVGFVNPAVYSIGKTRYLYPSTFHDITTGNNFNSGSATNFPAAPGYDLCTGWGTPNGTNLIAALGLPPPIANFSASPTNGVAPLTVTFIDLSSNVTSYSWFFGDGGRSSSANPSHVYTNAGNFTVALYAYGPSGSNILSRSNYIVVTNAPSPNVSPSISQPPQSLTILAGNNATFSVTASGTAPLDYQWRFNSTNISGAVLSNYTRIAAQPADAGNYSVVITNIAGAITSSIAVLTVTSAPPVVSFSVSATNGFSPLAVVFNNSSSGAMNYSWDFGDGQTNSSISPTNVYHNQGDYTVSLTAFGPGGQTTLVKSNFIVLKNAPPVLSAISDKTLLEMTLLAFTNVADDADVSQHLAFSLSNAPAGAVINPTNGIFAWTPTEAQGPATNQISVIVTDDGTPPLSATQTFAVITLESNLPPVLASIADRTIHAGTMLTITNSATDPDFPQNALTFNLSTFNIKTATINPTNGIFTWTPDNTFTNTTNNFTVIVTDFNPWAVNSQHLTDSKTFHVVVEPPPSFTSSLPVLFTNGAATLQWSAIPGQMYEVQYTDDLTGGNWTALSDITATNSTVSVTDETAPQTHRFYRIVIVP